MTEAEHARRTPSPQRGEGWGEGAPAVGSDAAVRHDWTRPEVRALYDLPFPELVPRARRRPGEFRPARFSLFAALDQDRRMLGGLRLLSAGREVPHEREGRTPHVRRLRDVRRHQGPAKKAGCDCRFCMGAAWREVRDRARSSIPCCEMVRGRPWTGAWEGMLHPRDAHREPGAAAEGGGALRRTTTTWIHRPSSTAPSSPRARTTIAWRRSSTSGRPASQVCSGGIIGLGETREDRVGMIATLASLPAHPESVPINMLVARCRHAARRRAHARAARIRPHRRGGPHHHAALHGAALRRPRGHERGDPGVVLSWPAPIRFFTGRSF